MQNGQQWCGDTTHFFVRDLKKKKKTYLEPEFRKLFKTFQIINFYFMHVYVFIYVT